MPKSYQVSINTKAERDVRSIHDFIAGDNPLAARKWSTRILRAMASLRSMPFRCEVVPEELGLDREYRHLIHGNYRVIFRVDDDAVVIVRVFHAARLLSSWHLRENGLPLGE